MSNAAPTAAHPPSPVEARVDFDAPGIHHGTLDLPHSSETSAWGRIRIPVAVLRNGAGPTALLTGGNHGDEYEGPIALARLARELDPGALSGRVIVLPAMNLPALKAGTRLSPIDGGNLNRSFPGRPDGTVTEKIADFVSRVLLPMADIVLDIHSGGKTLNFLPFAGVHALPDPDQRARCEAAMDAFGAPYGVVMREVDAAGMFDTTAEAMGKTFVTTELGGAGGATARTVAIALAGCRNLLRHAGILAGRPDGGPVRRLDMSDPDGFVVADEDGILEPCVDLGDPVRRGDLVARVHRIERPGGAPAEHRARASGLLLGRHWPGPIAAGDSLAVIAEPV